MILQGLGSAWAESAPPSQPTTQQVNDATYAQQPAPLQLHNRIIIAPMCQYSAIEGSATDWHLIHLGHLALSGAGLLILEATAVTEEGRITPGDLGLYSDANEAALARVLAAVRAHPTAESRFTRRSGGRSMVQLAADSRRCSVGLIVGNEVVLG